LAGLQQVDERFTADAGITIRKPTPLAADDMHEGVSHGAKAAAQIARELLGAHRGHRSQNPVVRPTVVFVKQLNVILSHFGGRLTLSPAGFYLAPRRATKPATSKFLSHHGG